ncbi:MAG: hypothetical protein WC365_05060 [Candidatus Babeliales bacterium]
MKKLLLKATFVALALGTNGYAAQSQPQLNQKLNCELPTPEFTSPQPSRIKPALKAAGLTYASLATLILLTSKASLSDIISPAAAEQASDACLINCGDIDARVNNIYATHRYLLGALAPALVAGGVEAYTGVCAKVKGKVGEWFKKVTSLFKHKNPDLSQEERAAIVALYGKTFEDALDAQLRAQAATHVTSPVDSMTKEQLLEWADTVNTQSATSVATTTQQPQESVAQACPSGFPIESFLGADQKQREQQSSESTDALVESFKQECAAEQQSFSKECEQVSVDIDALGNSNDTHQTQKSYRGLFNDPESHTKGSVTLPEFGPSLNQQFKNVLIDIDKYNQSFDQQCEAVKAQAKALREKIESTTPVIKAPSESDESLSQEQASDKLPEQSSSLTEHQRLTAEWKVYCANFAKRHPQQIATVTPAIKSPAVSNSDHQAKQACVQKAGKEQNMRHILRTNLLDQKLIEAQHDAIVAQNPDAYAIVPAPAPTVVEKTVAVAQQATAAPAPISSVTAATVSTQPTSQAAPAETAAPAPQVKVPVTKTAVATPVAKQQEPEEQKVEQLADLQPNIANLTPEQRAALPSAILPLTMFMRAAFAPQDQKYTKPSLQEAFDKKMARLSRQHKAAQSEKQKTALVEEMRKTVVSCDKEETKYREQQAKKQAKKEKKKANK